MSRSQKAAVGNVWYGIQVMTQSLDRRRVDVQITEEVVKTAAGNENGKEVMMLLLDRPAADVQITKVAKSSSTTGRRAQSSLSSGSNP